MRRSWGGVLVLATMAMLAAGCSTPPASQDDASPEPVSVSSALDRASVTVGQAVTWTIEIERAAEVEIEVEDPGSTVGGLAVVDSRREEETLRSGRVRERRLVRMRPDVSGSYVIPEVVVRWRLQAAQGTDPAPWSTESAARLFLEAEGLDVVSAEDGGDIRDIKALEPRPPLPWKPVAAALAGLLVLALGWWAWRRWRARRAVAPPPAPPWEVAWARLEALRQLDLEDEASLRAFHFELSEIVRAYVEGRFELNATDLTTEEIVAALDETGAFGGAPREALLRTLAATDRVKFARYQPGSEEVGRVWDDALFLVESTRPIGPESAESAGSAQVAA